MLRATFYIMACSAKNRARRQLARLREPRYLVGALAGIAFFYYTIFGRQRLIRAAAAENPNRRSFTDRFPVVALVTTNPAVSGVALLGMAAVSWLLPMSSSLLNFSRVETEMLFPAPVMRRQLLVYRLLRSQLAVLIGTWLFALIYPITSVEARVRSLFAVWLLLLSSDVYVAGVTLWQTEARVRPRSIAVRLAKGIPLGLFIGGLAALVFAVLTRAAEAPIANAADALAVIAHASQRRFIGLVLMPFVALVRPMFAESWREFAVAASGALVVYVALVCWVLLAEQAVDSVTEGTVERLAQPKTASPARYRARPMRWVLSTTGRAETAFVWKNVLQTLRVVDWRAWLPWLAPLATVTLVVTLIPRIRGLAQAASIVATFFTAFLAVMGPQILRDDLRRDLLHLDVLKTWPVRAAAIIRGEILWPACMVTLLTWGSGTLALVLSAESFPGTDAHVRIAVGLSGLILVPGIILAQFTVQNAAALLLPAWVLEATDRRRSLDAIGQRLIMLVGTPLVAIVSLLPTGIIGGVCWVLFHQWLGPWVLIPAAVIGLILMCVEVLTATELLGPAFDRLDITSIERAE
ncbi:MAG: hypothetical protein LBQ09_04140 [Acidobacteriaceae bacterium]|jgi:hypothetical protein|nr:hypothetical protein [Acidobacteriaceae bacterium]